MRFYKYFGVYRFLPRLCYLLPIIDSLIDVYSAQDLLYIFECMTRHIKLFHPLSNACVVSPTISQKLNCASALFFLNKSILIPTLL